MMGRVPRWHLFYTDIQRSSGVSWTNQDEAARYGKDRRGIPIPCGDPRDGCATAVLVGREQAQ